MRSMIRTLAASALAWMSGAWLALAAGEFDPLAGGVSPDKRYEVVVEPATEIPALRVLELPGRKDVGLGLWTGDLDKKDVNPPRKMATVLWQPKGQAVAINIEARRWRSVTLLAYAPWKKEFIAMPLPDYQTLTGHPRPPIEQLQRRGMYEYTSEDARVVGWTPEGHMLYELELFPSRTYTGNDPLKHRLTLAVSALQGVKVVRREVLPASGGGEAGK